MPTIELKNCDFRIVGVYLRVNDVFNDAVDPPKDSGIPTKIKVPTLSVEYDGDGPTVADVMASLQRALMIEGFTLTYQNIPGTGFLQTVSFGSADPSKPTYTLNSQTVSAQPSGDSKSPAAAWQYYIFDENETRVKVPRRDVYSESPIIKDGYRIIWRLIVTYLREESAQMQGIRAMSKGLV
ncbi:MAG: hypothetical protein AAGK67_18155 [Pseudomonadota bacterium]